MADKLKLRLVGEGPQTKALKTLASHLGIADKVFFVGRVPHMKVPNELDKLDIYVALSRRESESFGVAIIEAGAAARPVVVSDAGGLPEVVMDGKTGLIVPRDNPQMAADAILRLVRNRDLRIQLAENGQKHVAENYDWAVCIRQMVNLFNETIEQYKKK